MPAGPEKEAARAAFIKEKAQVEAKSAHVGVLVERLRASGLVTEAPNNKAPYDTARSPELRLRLAAAETEAVAVKAELEAIQQTLSDTTRTSKEELKNLELMRTDSRLARETRLEEAEKRLEEEGALRRKAREEVDKVKELCKAQHKELQAAKKGNEKRHNNLASHNKASAQP